MEKMIFHSEDREILRDLFKCPDGKMLFFFHDEYLLSPAQVSRSLQKFSELHLVEIDNEMVRLTEIGRKWVLANRRAIFFNVGHAFWKDPLIRKEWPEDELYREILESARNDYRPKMKRMNLEFFAKRSKVNIGNSGD